MAEPLRLIIVEDSADDAELLARHLRRGHWAVSFVRVETSADLAAELAGGRVDVVIADYRIPGFGGLEALRVVQQAGLDVPFILVSGTIGEDAAVAVMKAGAHDFVLKSKLDRLPAAIERELREATVRRERRRAEASLRFLADLGAALAQPFARANMYLNVARLVATRLGDWCLILEGDEAGERLLEFAHAEQSMEALLRERAARISLGPEAGDLANGDEPHRSRELDERDLEEPRLAPLAEWLRLAGFGAALRMPIELRGRRFGTLFWGRTTPRHFDDQDHLLADQLANRLAMAAETERLFRERDEALRAREQFLALASHELRTPLTSLTLQLEQLRRATRSAGDPRVQDAAGLALRQTERLSALVGVMLDVSQIGAGALVLQRESLNLGELVREVVGRFQLASSRAGCTIVALIPEGAVVGLWDRVRLEQIVTNLVSNAIKYGAGKPIEIGVEGHAGLASLSVRDHGIGISPEDSEHVFERFGRASSALHYAGLGVGLYLTRFLVEAHGGTIHLSSTPGEGACFSVHLPQRPPDDDGRGARQAARASDAYPLP